MYNQLTILLFSISHSLVSFGDIKLTLLTMHVYVKNVTHALITYMYYVDPCDNNPCVNGGTCSSNGGQFTCKCPPEYKGQLCNVAVNPCDSKPCKHGGTCSPGIGLAYTCSCSAGYTGPTCAVDIDECDPNPCLNNTSPLCIDGIAQYTCHCTTNCVECAIYYYLNTSSNECINISACECISR